MDCMWSEFCSVLFRDGDYEEKACEWGKVAIFKEHMFSFNKIAEGTITTKYEIVQRKYLFLIAPNSHALSPVLYVGRACNNVFNGTILLSEHCFEEAQMYDIVGEIKALEDTGCPKKIVHSNFIANTQYIYSKSKDHCF